MVAGLARAYLNLGVLQAQSRTPAPASERFAQAAELFENAAELDPDFPQVQSSLGVACFNARQFDKAIAPLERALAQSPDDGGLRRMLAMSLLNTEAWEKAARLLQDDPEREANTLAAVRLRPRPRTQRPGGGGRDGAVPARSSSRATRPSSGPCSQRPARSRERTRKRRSISRRPAR